MMRNFRILVAIILAACWPGIVSAQQEKCDIHMDPFTISQPYNPLSPNDYAASFTATVRNNSLPFTAQVSLILLRKGTDNRPYQMFVLRDDGGAGGVDIINPAPGPVLQEGLDDAGEIDLDFALAGGTASRTVDLQLRIPAGSDLPPGTFNQDFDLKFLCDFTNQPSVSTKAHHTTLNFTVASALQAALIGTEPDFGEIGNLTTAQVAVAPLTTTQRIHYLRVASSGPYEVRVQSQNGWQMTASGAPTSVPNERIAYRYQLLKQTLDSTRLNFTPVKCRASGLGGMNIPLTATLTEGGEGKLPSFVYRDIVTITITPMAVGTGGLTDCP